LSRAPGMLRTRLFFGLLPLLLVTVGVGAYAIRVCHELAGPVESELVGANRAALGLRDMRSMATLMSNALAFGGASDPIGARRLGGALWRAWTPRSRITRPGATGC